MVVDKLIKQNIEEEERKRKQKRDFYMEEEETLSYMPYKSEGYINDGKSIYTGFGDTGINNELSIYDKQAIFRVGGQ